VPLVIAAGLLGLIVVLRRVHVRAAITYLALSVAVWIALFESGVHATVAGVALGLATPAIAFQRPRAVSDEARRIADSTKDEPSDPDADTDQWQRLAALSRDVVSPLTRQERSLHPWTSFVIVPAFALANAGVRITRTAVTARTIRIILAVAVALAVGKLVGISLGVVAARRAGSELPAGAGVRHMAGVAALGGIGFTVSLFVATLAFSDQTMLNAAKLGVLCGSAVAGIAGATTLSRLRRGGVAHDRP
jgi:NhaA family Na+:H+ antiporter